jgi:hypothetical protein
MIQARFTRKMRNAAFWFLCRVADNPIEQATGRTDLRARNHD